MDSSPLSRATASAGLRRKKSSFASAGLYQSITTWALTALAFLFPLLFLPFTVEAFEVNKQILFVVLTLVATTAWIGSMVVEKKLSFRCGWVNLLPAIVLVGILLSSIFSLAGYQSWVGEASQEYASFLTAAMGVLLFYVLMNRADGTQVQRRLILTLFLSSSLMGFQMLLSLFGWNILPFVRGRGFNPIGTVNAFLSFFTVVSTLGMGLWLVSRKDTREDLLPGGRAGVVVRGLILFVVLSNLLFLAAVDFWILWMVQIIAALVLLAFPFLQGEEFGRSSRFVLPLCVLVVSLLFVFLPSPLARFRLPMIVSPSYGTSFSIAKQTLSQNPLRLFFGSGPGTFVYDYVKYRPAEVNETAFWSLRFDRAKTHVLTVLSTLGIVGLLSWMAFGLFVAAKSLARLLRERQEDEWKMTYVLFAGWVTIVAVHLLYSSNMALTILLWLLTGLLASQGTGKVRERDFSHAPKLGLIFSFLFVLAGVGVLATLFMTGQRYASEVALAQAVRLDGQGAPTEQVVAKLAKAVSLNQLSDVSYRNLSQALLLRTKDVLATAKTDEKGNLSAEQTTQIQNLVTASMNATARATTLAPFNALNWALRGNTYAEVLRLVGGAEDAAAASYAKAIELEPLNPAYQASLGRLHLLVADRARALKASENKELATAAAEAEPKELKAAEDTLNKAIEMKGDYALAHYYLAAVFERQGRMADAAGRLAALRQYRPLDVGLGFQLSMVYLKLEQYDAAKAELERVVGLSPKYSNARWYLASVYEIKGDLAKALEQIEQVAILNPENEAVQQRLTKLKAGELTTKIPNPVEEGGETATSLEGGEVVSPEE